MSQFTFDHEHIQRLVLLKQQGLISEGEKQREGKQKSQSITAFHNVHEAIQTSNASVVHHKNLLRASSSN